VEYSYRSWNDWVSRQLGVIIMFVVVGKAYSNLKLDIMVPIDGLDQTVHLGTFRVCWLPKLSGHILDCHLVTKY
jgi:hypothetical protein